MGVNEVKSSIRSAVFMERVNQSLMFRVPWRRRRQIMDELKTNLAMASQDHGSGEAINRLGDVNTLVKEYLEAEGGKVDVASGIMAAAITFVSLFALAAFASAVAIDVALTAVPAIDFERSYLGLFRVYTDGASEGLLISTELTVTSAFILPAIAFVIGSRLWRLFTRRSASSAA